MVVSREVDVGRAGGSTVLVTVCVDGDGGGAGLADTDTAADGGGAELSEGCRWVQTSASVARATPTAAAATHIALDTRLSGAGSVGSGCVR